LQKRARPTLHTFNVYNNWYFAYIPLLATRQQFSDTIKKSDKCKNTCSTNEW